MTKYAERADYVWLYRAPSAVLHGDPDGMRMILEPTTDGREKIMIEFDVNYVNAVLVDAGSNAVFFCGHFIDRFSPKNTDLQSTISALNERFQRLMIRHRHGRNDKVLNEMQKELDR